MALLKQKDLEAERQNTIAEAMVAGVPNIPTFKAVRNFTPLVIAALQRAGNPYVVGRPGFEALGIKFDARGKQTTSPAQFAIAMMPATAEVVILLTCDREKLKLLSVDPAALEDAALDMLEDSTPEAMAGATLFLSQQLKTIAAARVVLAPSERKPEGKGKDAKKKRRPTG